MKKKFGIASSRFGDIMRGVSRDEELIGRLQWSLELSSFFLPFCVKLSAVAAACNLLAQISVQKMKKQLP